MGSDSIQFLFEKFLFNAIANEETSKASEGMAVNATRITVTGGGIGGVDLGRRYRSRDPDREIRTANLVNIQK